MDFRECKIKIMTETWDYKTVKYVFLCFLIISFVLAAESFVHYFIEPDTPETADILATIFVHLIPCLYIPLVGLFCLSKCVCISYFLCGVDIMYLVFQLHCLLYRYLWPDYGDWWIWKYTIGKLIKE